MVLELYAKLYEKWQKSVFAKNAMNSDLMNNSLEKIDSTVLKPVNLLCESFKLVCLNIFEK